MAYLTVKEARQRLDNKVSLTTVYRLIHNGKVEASRIGGRYLITTESLELYITQEGWKVVTPRPYRQKKERRRRQRA